MHYDTGKHCVFHHRYHIVWSTKYRYKVLTGRVRLRVRDILLQVCRENEVDIPRGVLSSDHVHMFVSVPQKDRHPGSGARDEGPFVQKSTTGVSRAAQALLGPQGPALARARVAAHISFVDRNFILTQNRLSVQRAKHSNKPPAPQGVATSIHFQRELFLALMRFALILNFSKWVD